MISLPQDQNSDYPAVDPIMVDTLVGAATSAMERASIPDLTTVSEVLSAHVIMLDQALEAVRALQDNDQRFANAAAIRSALENLLLEHGSVPN